MLAKGNPEVSVTLPSETEICFACFFRRTRKILLSVDRQNTFVNGGAAMAPVFLSARSICGSGVRGRS